MGSPRAYEQIVADLELEPGQFELTLRKEILWECETATDAEVRAMEKKKILETVLTIPRSVTTSRRDGKARQQSTRHPSQGDGPQPSSFRARKRHGPTALFPWNDVVDYACR